MLKKKKQILILNGSPSGRRGNCQRLILRIQKFLRPTVSIQVVQLAKPPSRKTMKSWILSSDALIFVSGTYWDSWGSPLQKFLEDYTDLEGTDAVLGKPCAVFILKHSVGGKGVLSRLQGVLSTMGFLIPPMSGMVYSLVSDLALKAPKNSHADDFWNLEDIERALQNLLLSLEIKVKWISWPIDSKNFRKTWLKTSQSANSTKGRQRVENAL